MGSSHINLSSNNSSYNDYIDPTSEDGQLLPTDTKIVISNTLNGGDGATNIDKDAITANKDIIYDQGLLHLEDHVFLKPPPMRDKHIIISNAFVSDAVNSCLMDNANILKTAINNADGSDVKIGHRSVPRKTMNNADGSDVSISHRIVRGTSGVLSMTINNADGSDVTFSHGFVRSTSDSNTSNTQNSNAGDHKANFIFGSLDRDNTTDKEDDGKDGCYCRQWKCLFLIIQMSNF